VDDGIFDRVAGKLSSTFRQLGFFFHSGACARRR
jgi:hypothetical protein